MMFSVIIPVYNRSFCIERAIKSAIGFLSNDEKSEIIIVDDGSKDDTISTIEKFIVNQKHGPFLSLVKHGINKGVCAAKNTGARAARGEWIIFLDSDDEIIPTSYDNVVGVLEREVGVPIHFFSCVGDIKNGDLQKINFNQYLRHGTYGEKLPIINREVFNIFPYDEDIAGYEGLSYMRIIKKYGYACLHELCVRLYYTECDDQLSSPANIKKRSASIAVGHWRALSEHFQEMSITNLLLYLAKYFKTRLTGIFYM